MRRIVPLSQIMHQFHEHTQYQSDRHKELLTEKILPKLSIVNSKYVSKIVDKESIFHDGDYQGENRDFPLDLP